MDKIIERGITGSDSPTSSGGQDTPLDLEDVTQLEKDLEDRVQQIARWNPGEEQILDKPRAAGITSDIWRRLLVGWLDDPILANRYSRSTLRGLQMVLRDFDSAQITIFVRSLLRPPMA